MAHVASEQFSLRLSRTLLLSSYESIILSSYFSKTVKPQETIIGHRGYTLMYCYSLSMLCFVVGVF